MQRTHQLEDRREEPILDEIVREDTRSTLARTLVTEVEAENRKKPFV